MLCTPEGAVSKYARKTFSRGHSVLGKKCSYFIPPPRDTSTYFPVFMSPFVGFANAMWLAARDSPVSQSINYFLLTMSLMSGAPVNSLR